MNHCRCRAAIVTVRKEKAGHRKESCIVARKQKVDDWHLETRPRTTFSLLQKFLQNDGVQQELVDLRDGMAAYLRDGTWTAEQVRNAVTGLLLVTSLGHCGAAIRMVTVGEWIDWKRVGPENSQAVHVRGAKHKTRRFYGPADIFIQRPYIAALVTVSGKTIMLSKQD